MLFFLGKRFLENVMGLEITGEIDNVPVTFGGCNLVYVGDTGWPADSHVWQDNAADIVFGYFSDSDTWEIGDLTLASFDFLWNETDNDTTGWDQIVPAIDPGVTEIFVDWITLGPGHVFPVGTPSPQPQAFGVGSCPWD